MGTSAYIPGKLWSQCSHSHFRVTAVSYQKSFSGSLFSSNCILLTHNSLNPSLSLSCLLLEHACTHLQQVVKIKQFSVQSISSGIKCIMGIKCVHWRSVWVICLCFSYNVIFWRLNFSMVPNRSLRGIWKIAFIFSVIVSDISTVHMS